MIEREICVLIEWPGLVTGRVSRTSVSYRRPDWDVGYTRWQDRECSVQRVCASCQRRLLKAIHSLERMRGRDRDSVVRPSVLSGQPSWDREFEFCGSPHLLKAVRTPS